MRLTIVLLLAACLAAAPATKPVQHLRDDAPDEVKLVFYATRPETKKARLTDLRDQLAAARKELARIQAAKVGDGSDYAGIDAKNEARKSQQTVIDALAAEQRLLSNLKPKDAKLRPYVTKGTGGRKDSRPLAAGTVGLIHVHSVSQVIDGTTALVQVMEFAGSTGIGFDEGTEQDLWLTGIDTTGWVDDRVINKSIEISVTGTHQFGTALGASRTILQAELFDMDKFLAD